MAKIGDIVRFLNSVGGGRIARIDGVIAHVVDEDGFEIPMLLKECVVVAPAESRQASNGSWTAAGTPVGGSNLSASAPTPAPRPEPVVAAVAEEPLPIEETAEGEKLNVVIGFEPQNIKALSTTAVDMSLVNDSNYFLSFVVMSRRDEEPNWTLRYSGTVEPNIQLLLAELTTDDLAAFDHLAVQYVAFKADRSFTLKEPGSFETRVDTTKFFRLHCYKSHIYFENDVIAFTVVDNDRVEGQKSKAETEKNLAAELTRKKEADKRPVKRPVSKRRKDPARRNGDIIEVDLHINELVDTIAGLSNADMLNLQIDTFRRVMEQNRNHKGQRIVFIHGKGEGVLRQALMKELNNRYKGNDVQDASFREYGFGATQVTIR